MTRLLHAVRIALPRLLVALLLSTPLFASPIGYISERTDSPVQFLLSVWNVSDQPFGIEFHLLDVNGVVQDVGFGSYWPLYPVEPGNGQQTGTGNFVTSGTWSATIITLNGSFDIAGGFAPIGEWLAAVPIDYPNVTVPPISPDPTPQVPEPSSVMLIAATMVLLLYVRRSQLLPRLTARLR